MPQSMAMTVEPLATRMELSRYRAIGARSQMSMKLVHNAVTGRMVPWGLKISARLFRAVQNMAK